MALHVERTDAALQVVEIFKQLRDFTHSKLTATVEEDNSQREHFEEIKIREEKAMSEKQQLQQKLKLERIERQKQANLILAEEASANAQLNAMKSSHESRMAMLHKNSATDCATKQDASRACVTAPPV